MAEPQGAAPQGQQPQGPGPLQNNIQANQQLQSRYRVKIVHSNATDVYLPAKGMELRRGDLVIVPTRYGSELGRVQGAVCQMCAEARDAQSIERKASQEEIERFQLHKQKELAAFQTCRTKIAEHGLEMKLVSAHYLINEAKILFYFTAEARVDFRELVKDLVGIFKMRIELRQIGVRDEARVVGGMGVCGRTYCCHGITDKLKAVSIKMAKEQNLTLNSMKISGPCGRLLCCLAYEYDTYRECRRNLPQEGSRINANGQTLKVTDVNIFTGQVKLEGEEGESLSLDFQSFFYDPAQSEWRIQEA